MKFKLLKTMQDNDFRVEIEGLEENIDLEFNYSIDLKPFEIEKVLKNSYRLKEYELTIHRNLDYAFDCPEQGLEDYYCLLAVTSPEFTSPYPDKVRDFFQNPSFSVSDFELLAIFKTEDEATNYFNKLKAINIEEELNKLLD